jgi:hypothetical protein
MGRERFERETFSRPSRPFSNGGGITRRTRIEPLLRGSLSIDTVKPGDWPALSLLQIGMPYLRLSSICVAGDRYGAEIGSSAADEGTLGTEHGDDLSGLAA